MGGEWKQVIHRLQILLLSSYALGSGKLVVSAIMYPSTRTCMLTGEDLAPRLPSLCYAQTHRKFPESFADRTQTRIIPCIKATACDLRISRSLTDGRNY